MKSLSLSKPHLIVVVGIPGSGKTFFAEKFAETFNAPCISETAISRLADGVTDTTPLFLYQLDELLKTKQSVVIDGKSDARAERVELAKRGRSHGYETLLVWVQTDNITAKNRIIKTTTDDEYERRFKRFTSPSASEKPVVISGKHTYASQAKVVLKKLSSPRAEISSHTTPPVRPEPTATGRRNITIR